MLLYIIYMLSFKNFVNEAETMIGDPVPPGVDPAMWANPSYQKFWKAQNQQQNAAPKMGQQAPVQQQKPVQQRAYQDIGSIDNAVKTYLSRLPGFPANGTLRNLPDMELIGSINNKIKTGEIPLQPTSIRAMEAGRGVHFYRDKIGNIAFVVNR